MNIEFNMIYDLLFIVGGFALGYVFGVGSNISNYSNRDKVLLIFYRSMCSAFIALLIDLIKEFKNCEEKEHITSSCSNSLQKVLQDCISEYQQGEIRLINKIKNGEKE